jgi:hypothetical protein
MRKFGCRARRRAGAAARADHTHDGIAFLDVVVQEPQQSVGARLLAEAALHPQLEAARLQIVRHRVARPPNSLVTAERKTRNSAIGPCPRRPAIRPETREQGNVRDSWRRRFTILAPAIGGGRCAGIGRPRVRSLVHYRPRRFAFHSPSSGRRYAAKASPSRRPVQRRPNPRLRAVLAHPEHVPGRLDFWSITVMISPGLLAAKPTVGAHYSEEQDKTIEESSNPFVPRHFFRSGVRRTGGPNELCAELPKRWRVVLEPREVVAVARRGARARASA